jgi:hypothetical protein
LLAGLVHSPADAAFVSLNGGGSPGCSIANNGDVLKLSGVANNNKPSTLTITDITGTNISTDKNDYVIGKITLRLTARQSRQ